MRFALAWAISFRSNRFERRILKVTRRYLAAVHEFLPGHGGHASNRVGWQLMAHSVVRCAATECPVLGHSRPILHDREMPAVGSIASNKQASSSPITADLGETPSPIGSDLSFSALRYYSGTNAIAERVHTPRKSPIYWCGRPDYAECARRHRAELAKGRNRTGEAQTAWQS
jgi:hypothetical protein